MKSRIFLFFLFLINYFPSFSQITGKISGTITDDVEHFNLANVSVAVLNAKDSTLVSYTRSAQNGSFFISGLAGGNFILLVAGGNYADYVEHFHLDPNTTSYNFDRIVMQLKSRMLKEVLIKGTASEIKIRGDTTEYNSKAFKVQPNSKVEDLLKQLPGIQIDKDGKITAHGETVKRVLVDGEEFFGDDPTLVTKNIRADMVDKVQLYNQKSDQATFTGIDDGQKTKTINIKLKEDKKNGYFGKADIGYGTSDFYQAQILFNKFRDKEKFSAYSTTSNDGKTGLGWQDSQKYAASSNIQTGEGFYTINNSGDDLDSWNGNYGGKGVPKVVNSGVHYDNKWNNDKESLNANYKTSFLTIDGIDSLLTKNNLPNGDIINSTSNQNYHNHIFKNKIDGNYQIKLDTTSTLKLVINGIVSNSQVSSKYLSSSQRNTDTLINTSARNIIDNVKSNIFDQSAFYTKKFKGGRNFSWSVSNSINKNESLGYLKTNTKFFNNNGQVDSSQLIDQKKVNDLKKSFLTTNLMYSEPLTKIISLTLNYGLGIENNSADRKSFSKAMDGTYSLFDSLFSNNYRLRQLTNQVGAIFSIKSGKSLVNFGTKASKVKFKQLDVTTGMQLKRNFDSWTPQINYQYKISQHSTVFVNYLGRTDLPTANQMQPIVVNTDPLNVFVGNSLLKPSFTNSFEAGYNAYSPLKDQYFFMNGNYSFTSSPIVNNTYTDLTGKTTTQYANINKHPFSYFINTSFGQKLFASGPKIGLVLNSSGTKKYGISNGVFNVISNYNIQSSVQIQESQQGKFDATFSIGPSVHYGGSSLQPNLTNNGHGLHSNGEITIFLPFKFSITSEAEYQYNSKTAMFNDDYSRLLWNTWLVKSFSKQENFKITFTCNDILNQNSGFDRNSSGVMITQENYTTIKRFFLITLVWDFNKLATKKIRNN